MLVALGAFMDQLHPTAEVRRRLFAAGFAAVRIPLLSRWLKPVRIAGIR